VVDCSRGEHGATSVGEAEDRTDGLAFYREHHFGRPQYHARSRNPWLLWCTDHNLCPLLAASALAIGTAWAGLLANFAAGAFLLVLRPFKVGDFITTGGITGTVHEIGLFVTTFDTPDNVRTFVGNNKIFSDNIQNYTANPYRRVELTAQISGAANPQLAISRLKDRLANIANVWKTPAPEVTILTFNPFGPVLAVRPFCHNDHYWQVYFDPNMAIREVLGDAAFPGPTYPLAVAEARKAAAS